MSAPYEFELDGCFAERIGEAGLSCDAYARALEATRPVLAGLAERHARGELAFLRGLASSDELAALEATAQGLKERFERILVIATGGSSLGGRTLATLAEGSRLAPSVRFLENVDPESLSAALASIEAARTGFLVISKSGRTVETVSQTLVAIDRIGAELGRDALSERFVMVTEPGDNPLRRLAARFGFTVLDHDPELGGRFAAFSLVGLLPALFAGLDGRALRRAGARVAQDSLGEDPARSAPARGAAAIWALARERGVRAHVVMPYADRLYPFALWFRQLWAESLGKAGGGTTPIAALGTVDQHSQLQLYLDGPADKVFSLVLPAYDGEGATIPRSLAGEVGVEYLSGRTIGDVIAAGARATADALGNRARPVRLFRLARLDAESLGALMMHFMIETVITAGLSGVDPFDQPALEEGKRLARDYLREMKR